MSIADQLREILARIPEDLKGGDEDLELLRRLESAGLSTGALPLVSLHRELIPFRESADGHVYVVQFKRTSRAYIMHTLAFTNPIMPGEWVRVEADRGIDVGIVLSRTLELEYNDPLPMHAGKRERGFFSTGAKKCLLGRASELELKQLADKLAAEEEALGTIIEQVALRGIPMKILDAEYQFDRQKLTFFFASGEVRTDFRALVQELFSRCRCRIWMAQIDMSCLREDDPGYLLAKRSGLLKIRGTRLELATTMRTNKPSPLEITPHSPECRPTQAPIGSYCTAKRQSETLPLTSWSLFGNTMSIEASAPHSPATSVASFSSVSTISPTVSPVGSASESQSLGRMDSLGALHSQFGFYQTKLFGDATNIDAELEQLPSYLKFSFE